MREQHETEQKYIRKYKRLDYCHGKWRENNYKQHKFKTNDDDNNKIATNQYKQVNDSYLQITNSTITG